MTTSRIEPNMAVALHEPRSIDPVSVAGVLTEISEIASETLELQDVFGRVAACIRRVIPFDHMGVVRILDGEWAVKHATTLDLSDCTECSAPMALSSWSKRIRPRPESIPRIDDARAELDPSFPGDAGSSKGLLGRCCGSRSAPETVVRRRRVAVRPRRRVRSTDEHQQMLRPIAALLGSAVEHWRIWDAERRRRQRLDRIEALLGTLAESLDVREIFERHLAGIQPILPASADGPHRARRARPLHPHRRLRRSQRTSSRPCRPSLSRPTELERRLRNSRSSETSPPTLRPRPSAIVSSSRHGMRSWLRVPVGLRAKSVAGSASSIASPRATAGKMRKSVASRRSVALYARPTSARRGGARRRRGAGARRTARRHR